MTFEHVLNQNFPGAVKEPLFVERTAHVLGRKGFHRDNTIACVACCRDEISQTIQEEARRAWGQVFNKSSLGGMIVSGKTGFGAALAHAPQIDTRERYVFYAMPHVAIGPNGEEGFVEREGRNQPSSACGALISMLGELQAGQIDTRFQPDDIEQSLLRARIVAQLKWGHAPDLFALTRTVHGLILDDLENTIKMTVDTDNADYAVMTGIQIHGPKGANYVQPLSFYVVESGSRQELDLNEDVAA